MPQAATIKSLPRAFRMMKTLQAQGIEWGEDYRRAGALALKDVLEGMQAQGIEWGEDYRRPGSIAIWTRWPSAARPTGATAATAAG